MKTIVVPLMCLSLTACLSGGGSGAATIAQSPIDSMVPDNEPAPSEPPESQPTSPSMTLDYFSSKSLTSAYGSLSISNGLLTDSYCGHTFPVVASSESNGVVTISVDGWSGLHQAEAGRAFMSESSSFAEPNHQDCQVNVLPIEFYYFGTTGITKVYFAINGSENGQVASFDLAYRVTYEISMVNLTAVVKRSLKSREYRRSGLRSDGTYLTLNATRAMSEMNYNLQ